MWQSRNHYPLLPQELDSTDVRGELDPGAMREELDGNPVSTGIKDNLFSERDR